MLPRPVPTHSLRERRRQQPLLPPAGGPAGAGSLHGLPVAASRACKQRWAPQCVHTGRVPLPPLPAVLHWHEWTPFAPMSVNYSSTPFASGAAGTLSWRSSGLGSFCSPLGPSCVLVAECSTARREIGRLPPGPSTSSSPQRRRRERAALHVHKRRGQIIIDTRMGLARRPAELEECLLANRHLRSREIPSFKNLPPRTRSAAFGKACTPPRASLHAPNSLLALQLSSPPLLPKLHCARH